MNLKHLNFKIDVLKRVCKTSKRVVNSFTCLPLIALCCLAVLSIKTASADDFITQWTFQESRTEVVFMGLTNGPVEYTWTASPSGNSGNGSFTAQAEQEVVLSGLDIEAGDIVTMSMAAENLWRFYMIYNSDSEHLTDVLQWGTVNWASMENMFWGCTNLTISATDVPALTNVTSMKGMFFSTLNFNGDISDWDVSNVTTMEKMFWNAQSFNGDIGSWDVSNVTDMSSMFKAAFLFDRDISGWDVSAVADMGEMFHAAYAFNQPIGSWDVSSVTDMREMFRTAYAFNQPLDSWDITNVNSLYSMFSEATSFNQDIGNWDLSSVTSITFMFMDADSFNQDIGDWNVSNVQYMTGTFAETDVFNRDIGNWDVSSVENMSEMFRNASAFNQDIGDWDVSSVESMNGMFREVEVFNQDIGNWDVSNVEGMWDIFHDASSFNQNLGAWILNTSVALISTLDNSGLDCDNYTATLVGWYENNPNVNNRTLGADGMEYGTFAATARDSLIIARGWNIQNDSPSDAPCNGLLSSEELAKPNEPSILIYPNPTQDRVIINAPPSELERISILNSQGKDVTSKTTMRDKSNGEKEIDLRLLNAGIYFVRTATTAKIVVKE